jgi:hypothetical protein
VVRNKKGHDPRDGADQALFVGEDQDPILIDRSALQIAINQGWATANASNVPVLSFRPNSDRELEAIDLDIDLGPIFE